MSAENEQTGVRDYDQLASAVFLPQQTYGQKELYPTVPHKAAALLRSLIKNHPFYDRNKRTALLATVIFPDYNGFELVASESQLLKFVLRIARTRNPDRQRIKSWLERHSRKRRPMEPRHPRSFLGHRWDIMRDNLLRISFGRHASSKCEQEMDDE